jgi:hypothetical protein
MTPGEIFFSTKEVHFTKTVLLVGSISIPGGSVITVIGNIPHPRARDVTVVTCICDNTIVFASENFFTFLLKNEIVQRCTQPFR